MEVSGWVGLKVPEVPYPPWPLTPPDAAGAAPRALSLPTRYRPPQSQALPPLRGCAHAAEDRGRAGALPAMTRIKKAPEGLRRLRKVFKGSSSPSVAEAMGLASRSALLA